jgi:hypothetical protein
MRVDYGDLESKGFVLIKSFLSEEELLSFENDFIKKKNGFSINANYNVPSISSQNVNLVQKKIDSVLDLTSAEGIKADLIEGGAYFCTNDGQNFPWHQDHESYYTCQNHKTILISISQLLSL